MKKEDIALGVLVSLLLVGPIVAGPILIEFGYVAAGILVFAIPYSVLILLAFLLRMKKKKSAFKIPDGHKNFNIIPVKDPEILRALYQESALTFFGEINDKGLDGLYNWLGSEGVLKAGRLDLYVYDGKMLKDVFGKDRKFGDEEQFMSIFLKDLNLNEPKLRQFSADRLSVGGRWLDDIVDNSGPEQE